ncbi:filamentous hemagglutinin family protein [Rubrivivax gelatinosus]|uniref:MBG domain-containing protein n=1 Tax=Rubrivivax gelatinosus TaxID=28068 RepID=UPI0018C9FA87|nr:MBG domain-containing protein [Rubrivivax gelatinosus]MBG6080642.1 filamentous hemagglutinin family protein [Rubrivivax gelatinosus]
MNRCHATRYNESLGAWVAVSEKTRGCAGRATARTRRRAVAAAAAAALAAPAFALDAGTLPTGGRISAGAGSISTGGSTLTVQQSGGKLAIDWQSFSIGSSGTVRFVQPGRSSVALNRVLGNDASQIYGRLDANGQVFLLNPNGVLFAKSAQVQVGGLVATTLSLADDDFLAGRYRFAGSAGSVVNEGSLGAASGGYVALLGGQVSNRGTISARLGTVALAAGRDITLDFAGDGLIGVVVNQGTLQALAENRQLIEADGGTVLMTAKTADRLVQSVVNNDGVIEARTVDGSSGTIKLIADMDGGVVAAGGRLDASAPDGGNGGFVDTSAAQVLLAEGLQVSTLAASGRTGTWLIDPYDITISASGSNSVSVSVSGNPWTVSPTSSGANINNSTLSAYLSSSNVALSTVGAGSEAGNITVNAPVSWSAATTLTLNADSSTGGVFVNAAINGSNAGSGLVLNAGSGGVSQSSGGNIRAGTLAVTAASGGSVDLTHAVNQVTTLAASSAAGDFAFVGSTALNVTGAVASGGDLRLATTSGNLRIGAALDGGSSSSLSLQAGTDLVLAHALAWDGDAVVLDFGGSFDLAQGARLTLPQRSATLAVNGTGYTLVHDVAELQALGADTHYALAEDIDASATAAWNGGAGFVPLASFSGDLLGLGHAVDRLTIQRPGADSVGLFSRLDGTASDLTLSNVRIGGRSQVGAVAGELHGSLLGVNVTGEVSGTGNTVGGVAGSADGATLQQVASTAGVQGSTAVGGLVGRATGTGVSDAYATGAVQADAGSAGGLIGEVTGSSTLTRVYASGRVQGSTAGGLVGTGAADTTAANAYWDSGSTAQSASGGDAAVSGAADIQAQHYTQASYAGFDFTNTWVMLAGQTRPMLRSEYSTAIFTPHALQLMALDRSASYSLGTDLDLSATLGGGDVWGASGFVPVGSSGGTFSGRFDGQGHRISGLNIERAGTNYVGLFGYTQGATIADVHLVGGSVTGNDNVGALVGYMQDGTLTGASAQTDVDARSTGESNVGGLVGANDGGAITASWAGGDVTGAGYQAGGLVGYNFNGGSISRSYATGDVTGTSTLGGMGYVGGLVGANGYSGDGGSISGSYATGTVTASSGPVGGFVGHNEGSITDSYATGNVVGLGSSSNIGGFVGVNFANGTITGAYSTGQVSGTTNVGGFAGYNNNTASAISNAYWDTQTSGRSIGIAGGTGGATGRTTAQLRAGLPSGFSSTDWRIYQGYTYPLLRSFLTPLTVTANSGTRTYDGTTTGLGLSYSTAVDSSLLLGPTTGTLVSKNAGTRSVTAAGLYSGQQGYDITAVDGTVIVTQAAATVTADSGRVTYDGSTQSVTGFSATGLVGGETAAVLTGVSVSGSGRNAGTYTTHASGSDGNYTLSFVDGTLTIDKAAATVTADSARVTYNGGTQSVTGFGVSGLVGSDTAASLTGVSVSGSGRNAGTYTTHASGSDGNYTLSFVDGTLTIDKAAATVTADSARVTYNGGTQSVTGFGVSGLVGSDTAASLTGVSVSGSGRNAGTYATHASGSDGNYTLSFVDGTLTIDKAAATVTADSARVTYNGGTQSVTGFGVSGLVGGETAAVLTGVSVSGSGRNAGTYTTHASGSDGNYTLSFVDGTLTIDKAAATVTADSGRVTYNGGTQSVSGFSVTGLVGGETAAVLTGVSVSGSGRNAGTYTTHASGSDGNYTLSFVDGTLTIDKAAATVTADSGRTTYNGSTQSVSGFSATGLVGGETAAVLTGVSAGGSGRNAGTYTTRASGSDGNYDLSFVDGTLTIDKAALTVTALDASKAADLVAYRGGNGVSYTGFVGGEGADVLGGTLSYGGSSQGALQPGVYTISPGGLSAANYTLRYVDGTLTITAAPRPVTPADAGLGPAYAAVLAWLPDGAARVDVQAERGAAPVGVVDGGIRLPPGLDGCDAAGDCRPAD